MVKYIELNLRFGGAVASVDLKIQNLWFFFCFFFSKWCWNMNCVRLKCDIRLFFSNEWKKISLGHPIDVMNFAWFFFLWYTSAPPKLYDTKSMPIEAKYKHLFCMLFKEWVVFLFSRQKQYFSRANNGWCTYWVRQWYEKETQRVCMYERQRVKVSKWEKKSHEMK